MLYFALIFSVAFGLIAWRRLDLALIMALFFLPTYQLRFSLLGLPLTFLELMILIVAGVWLVQKTNFLSIIKRQYTWHDYCQACQQRAPYPLRYEITLIILASYLGVIIAGFSNSALGIWKAYFFEPILIFVLVMNVFYIKDEKGKAYFAFDKVIMPLLFSGLMVALVAVFQKLTGLFVVKNFWPRVTGPFPYPNALGLYLAPLVMLATTFSIKNFELRIKNYKLIAGILLIINYLIAIVFASSEGALVGIMAGWFIMGLLWLGGRFKNEIFVGAAKFFVFLFLGFSLVAPWFFLKIVPENKYYNFSSSVLNFVSDKVLLKDFSGEVRKQQWRETWRMMNSDWKTFCFGTGLSGYQEKVSAYHQEGIFFNQERDPEFRRKIVWQEGDYKARHWRPVEIYMYPHNIFLNFWTELGLLGVLAFFAIFVKVFNNLFKMYKSMEAERWLILGLLGAFTAIVVHGMVDVPYLKNDLSVMFWTMLGLYAILKLKLKRINQRNN